MLSKEYRIPKEQIPSIVRRGKRINGIGFDLKIWYDNALTHPHFAFVVSTKVDKRAPVRNTIKRKFRAAVYHLLKDNTFKNANYVFLIKDVTLADKKSRQITILIQSIIN